MAIVDVSLIAFLVLIVSLMITPEHRTATTHTATVSTATAQTVPVAS
jgi:hypothetical protein